MSTDNPPKLWEQQADEPDAAYVRFLLYRNLGPARTVAQAVQAQGGDKRKKTKLRVSQWEKDSSTWNWVARAQAWDVAMLQAIVPETASIIFQSIKQHALITLSEALSGKLRPQTWAELQEAIIVLSQFVSPEVITQAIHHSAELGVDSPGVGTDTPSASVERDRQT